MTSLRDIAARARVSIGTVDRVLHHRGRVAPATQARIRRLLREQDYRPNLHARTLSLARDFRFAVLLPRQEQDSGYWKLPVLGIRKAVRELEDYRVEARFFPFDRYSDSSFVRASAAALRFRPDGVLLAPVRGEAAARLVSSLSGTLPYALIDSSLPGGGALTTIVQDARQSGLLAAHLMRTIVQRRGHVAIVRVLPADFHIEDRIRGFLAGIGGGLTREAIIVEVDSRHGRAAFQQALAPVLRRSPSLCGIYVSNAWTHAVALAVRRLIPGRTLCIVGYDCVKENSALLARGGIDFLISQRPAMQGYEGIRSLFRHVVLGRRVPREITVPLDILTRENLAYYHD